MSRTTRQARKAARTAGSAAGTAARTTARTAADHPRAAAEGVGAGALVAVALAGYVVIRLVRSRRVQHAAARSAERGAFGPGVAAATRTAKAARRS